MTKNGSRNNLKAIESEIDEKEKKEKVLQFFRHCRVVFSPIFVLELSVELRRDEYFFGRNEQIYCRK